MKIIFICLLYCLPFAGLAGELAADSEQKKTFILRYDVQPQQRLTVHNRFGQVNVELWKKPQIQVTVRVVAHSTSQEALDRYLNAVTVKEHIDDDELTISTLIKDQEGVPLVAFPLHEDSSLANYIQVDYSILMPAENALTMTNQFGNTLIPSFKAPLAVVIQNGDFLAHSLLNNQTSIKVDYGNVDIRKMNDGEVDVAYGNLAVYSANRVKLTNTMGKLYVGKASELTTTVSYSELDIGLIQQSALMSISFSKRFHINRLPQTLTNLDMALSYSSVVLPLDRKSNYKFEANMTNSGFSIPAAGSLVLLTQSATVVDRDTVKRYSGVVGKGASSKVQLVGSYSTIDFK